MFFHRCSFKISCFCEFAYNSSVLPLIFWTASEVLAPYSKQQKLTKTASKSFSLRNSSQKLQFFAVLMYSLYSPTKYLKFKRKYQQARPVFPDHPSISYDYNARDLDEYFHFYSIAGQKFKMKKIFKKT